MIRPGAVLSLSLMLPIALSTTLRAENFHSCRQVLADVKKADIIGMFGQLEAEDRQWMPDNSWRIPGTELYEVRFFCPGDELRELRVRSWMEGKATGALHALVFLDIALDSVLGPDKENDVVGSLMKKATARLDRAVADGQSSNVATASRTIGYYRLTIAIDPRGFLASISRAAGN